MNHVLATFPHICPTMEQQGTVKFARDAPLNLGSLRPTVAERTARYDVANTGKCVGSTVKPFMKH